jgi:hypothetical protein
MSAPSKGIMRSAVLLILSLVCAAGMVLFALAYYDRYWRWRDCFNELGRCYDSASEEVFLEQAGLVWGSFAVICVLATALLAWRALRRG